MESSQSNIETATPKVPNKSQILSPLQKFTNDDTFLETAFLKSDRILDTKVRYLYAKVPESAFVDILQKEYVNTKTGIKLALLYGRVCSSQHGSRSGHWWSFELVP